MLIHSDKLEEEVGKASKVECLQCSIVSQCNSYIAIQIRATYDDNDHARQALLPGNVTGQDENQNGNRNRGDCECKFYVFRVDDNDHELDGEAEEEEEIELEECDVNLMGYVNTWIE